jgi:hypothetical protein
MVAGACARAHDQVVERRRAVALARHFREVEGLSIAQIAERLGRAPPTVDAYFYDPSYANKTPTTSPQERQFWALAGYARMWICKRLLGSRCDGMRPALRTTRFVRKQSPRRPIFASGGLFPLPQSGSAARAV